MAAFTNSTRRSLITSSSSAFTDSSRSRSRRLPLSHAYNIIFFVWLCIGVTIILWRPDKTDHPSAPKALTHIQQWDGSPPGHLFDPVKIPPQCPQTRRRRVIDMTLINNELSSLELRLNELWDVVDTFFIAESTVPFKPDAPPKPLHLTNHWEDFAKFHSKIVRVVIPPEVSEGTGARVDLQDFRPNFNVQNAQRIALWKYLGEKLDPQEDDLIIVADLDEIPRPHVIEKLACSESGKLPFTPICLETKDSFYYYNYRCHIKFEWTGRPMILHYHNYTRPYYERTCLSKMVNASTHCSSCFDSLESFHIKSISNSEPIRNPLQTDNASIIERVTSCKDFWLRTDLDKQMELRPSVDFGSIPMIVSQHPERWPHLLGKGPLYDGMYKQEAGAVSAQDTTTQVEGGSQKPRVVPICQTVQGCVQPYFPSPKIATCPVQDHLETSSTGAYIIPKNFAYKFDQKIANAILNITSGSLLELGAGVGCYSHYFESSGKLSRVSGFEGASNVYDLTGGFIKHADLTEKHDFGQFDWVVSLEVAEHIPPDFEATFVTNLIVPSPDGIILSWALPDQLGSGHVNGKTNEYVISLMKTHGFVHDADKSLFLRSEAELPWFKETTMVFTSQNGSS